MSKNAIYCYSGTGNCLNMAKVIASVLGDTDIIMMRHFPAITDATGYERVGFVVPCYGGGLPGGVEDYVKALKLSPTAYKFGVIQYAGYIGSGLHKIDAIVGLDYWNKISMHSSAIWLMPHHIQLPPMPVDAAVRRMEGRAKAVAGDVLSGKRTEKPPVRAIFAKENEGLQKINVLLNKKLTVSDACIGCGTCAKVCPRGNIKLENARPVIGRNCIACMSCVQYCPKEAINVGRITAHRERYRNKNVTVDELSIDVIHID